MRITRSVLTHSVRTIESYRILKHWFALHNNKCALKNIVIVTAFGQCTSKLSVCITQYFHRSMFKKKVTWKIEWDFWRHFRRVLNALFFLFCDSPKSEFYMPTFRNNRFHLHRPPTISTHLFFLLTPPMKMEQTEYSERSGYKIRTPGNHPKERVKNLNLFHYYFTKFYLI